MPDLKCPYCPEVRPSRSRMSVHMSYYHPDKDMPEGFRRVEDVTVIAPELAEPAVWVPTKADREKLLRRSEDVAVRLAKAAQEMSELRASMDAVDTRMAALDAQLTSPAVVRRQTLNLVWDKLIDQGHMGAASTVMRMINTGGDDA